jgi:hypothetical protein
MPTNTSASITMHTFAVNTQMGLLHARTGQLPTCFLANPKIVNGIGRKFISKLYKISHFKLGLSLMEGIPVHQPVDINTFPSVGMRMCSVRFLGTMAWINSFQYFIDSCPRLRNLNNVVKKRTGTMNLSSPIFQTTCVYLLTGH